MNELLQIGQLVTHAMGILTLCVAVSGINAWRRQVIGTRKIQLAERCLALFYEARDSLLWARARAIFTLELDDIERSEGESERDYKTRRSAFVVRHRIVKSMEVFSKLEASRYEFAAVFGVDSILPFKSIKSAMTGLLAAAEVLVDAEKTLEELREAGAPVEQKMREVVNYRRELWGADDGSDHVRMQIDAAMSAIENVCRPVLNHDPDRPFWRGIFS